MDNEYGMSPEQLQQLIALGVIDDKQGDLRDQYKQAQLMRNQGPARGQMAGRVYVADAPGALLAGMEKFQGARDMRKIGTEQDKLRSQQTNARMAYLQAMMQQRQLAGGATPGQAPPPAPMGMPPGGAPPPGGPGAPPPTGGVQPGGPMPPPQGQPPVGMMGGMRNGLNRIRGAMGF